MMGLKIGSDTRHANSGQSVEADVEASKFPLPQWAANFSEVGVKQVQLDFRRAKADKGLTE